MTHSKTIKIPVRPTNRPGMANSTASGVGCESDVAGEKLQRTYIIPILSKALTILDLVETSEEPLSARQIQESLGYSPATIYRILRTLTAHGVLKGCEHKSYSFRRIAEVKSLIGATPKMAVKRKK